MKYKRECFQRKAFLSLLQRFYVATIQTYEKTQIHELLLKRYPTLLIFNLIEAFLNFCGDERCRGCTKRLIKKYSESDSSPRSGSNLLLFIY